MMKVSDRISEYEKKQSLLFDQYRSNAKEFSLSMIGELPQPDPITVSVFMEAEIRLLNLSKLISQCLLKMVQQTKNESEVSSEMVQ